MSDRINANNTSNKHTVAIFDLDNTITKKDTYIAFLITLLRMHPVRLLRCGFLPIAVVLNKVGLKSNHWLKETFLRAIAGGIDKTHIDTCADQFVKHILLHDIRSKALHTIQSHHQAGHKLILASASFDFYVEKLADQLCFDSVICTRASWDEQGRLTGKINGNNCYGVNKLNYLIDSFNQKRTDMHLIGYSDHHSDQPFLEWVDHAVAVNPTKKLKQIALQHKFVIENWDSI